jgi:hypothetical protein
LPNIVSDSPKHFGAGPNPFWTHKRHQFLWFQYFSFLNDDNCIYVCVVAGAKGGLSWAKNLLVVLGIISYIVHAVGIFLDPSWYSFVIYVRNLFYGFSLLFATILILDFLSFHPLFGPWGIIIGELLMDVGKVMSNFSLQLLLPHHHYTFINMFDIN